MSEDTTALHQELELLKKERHEIREVLRDAMEEHGVTKVLLRLEGQLQRLQECLGAASLAESYGIRQPQRFWTSQSSQLSDIAGAREQVHLALRTLSALVRPAPTTARAATKLPAMQCSVCGALAGEVCKVGRHGAAWCYHVRCGRLMRGGVCDTCGGRPTMDEVQLIPELGAETEEGVVDDDLILGPRESAIMWCGSCGAAPGQQCHADCSTRELAS